MFISNNLELCVRYLLIPTKMNFVANTPAVYLVGGKGGGG